MSTTETKIDDAIKSASVKAQQLAVNTAVLKLNKLGAIYIKKAQEYETWKSGLFLKNTVSLFHGGYPAVSGARLLVGLKCHDEYSLLKYINTASNELLKSPRLFENVFDVLKDYSPRFKSFYRKELGSAEDNPEKWNEKATSDKFSRSVLNDFVKELQVKPIEMSAIQSGAA